LYANPRRAAERERLKYCRNCRKNGHEQINCREANKCRHCKVEISDNHTEMTCPKKNCCYYCGNAGHRRQDCGRLAEDKQNVISRNTLPEEKRNQRAESEHEQAQGEEMTLKEKMRRLAGVRRKQPILVIRFESRHEGIRIPTKKEIKKILGIRGIVCTQWENIMIRYMAAEILMYDHEVANRALFVEPITASAWMTAIWGRLKDSAIVEVTVEGLSWAAQDSLLELYLKCFGEIQNVKARPVMCIKGKEPGEDKFKMTGVRKVYMMLTRSIPIRNIIAGDVVVENQMGNRRRKG
jgi:hypothetical protein